DGGARRQCATREPRQDLGGRLAERSQLVAGLLRRLGELLERGRSVVHAQQAEDEGFAVSHVASSPVLVVQGVELGVGVRLDHPVVLDGHLVHLGRAYLIEREEDRLVGRYFFGDRAGADRVRRAAFGLAVDAVEGSGGSVTGSPRRDIRVAASGSCSSSQATSTPALRSETHAKLWTPIASHCRNS